MTSIVYDLSAIASAMKGDDWYAPAKKAEPAKASTETPKGLLKLRTELPPASFRKLLERRRAPRPSFSEALAQAQADPRQYYSIDEVKEAYDRGNEMIMPITPPNAELALRLQREMDEMRRRMIEYMYIAEAPMRIMMPMRDEGEL